MQKEHLLKLAEILENLKEEVPEVTYFNMKNWLFKNHCGYAACAIGSACLHPYFQNLGLKIKSYGEYEKNFGPTDGVGNDEWKVLKKIFELPHYHLEYLFSSYSYDMANYEITPEVVAYRIRNFVETDGEYYAY